MLTGKLVSPLIEEAITRSELPTVVYPAEALVCIGTLPNAVDDRRRVCSILRYHSSPDRDLSSDQRILVSLVSPRVLQHDRELSAIECFVSDRRLRVTAAMDPTPRRRQQAGQRIGSPHPCGTYGAAQPGRMLDSMALGW